MAKLGDNNSYDFNFLQQVWDEGGWVGLADFCSELGFSRMRVSYSGDKSDIYLICESINSVFDVIYDSPCNQIDNISCKSVQVVDLISTVLMRETLKKIKKITDKKRSQNHLEALRVLNGIADNSVEEVREILTAIINSNSIEETIIALGGKKIYRQAVYLDGSVISDIIIEDRNKNPLRWLLKAVNQEITEEEAWWNCAWIFIENAMEELLEIKKSIKSNQPVSDHQIDTLNWYYWEGHPFLRLNYDRAGNISYEIHLELDVHMINCCDLQRIAVVALAQPAFLLAQQLQSLEPRFVISCRSPFCGKQFYSGRKNATACPPTKNKKKKSKCQLEWIRYKRYLRDKVFVDPESNWNVEALQNQFIDYDNQ